MSIDETNNNQAHNRANNPGGDAAPSEIDRASGGGAPLAEGWVEIGIDIEKSLVTLATEDAGAARAGLEDRLTARAMAAFGGASGSHGRADVAGRISSAGSVVTGMPTVIARPWRFRGALSAAAVVALCAGAVFVGLRGTGSGTGTGRGTGAVALRVEVDIDTMLAGLAVLDAESETGAVLLQDAETLERSLRTGTTLEDLGAESL